MKKKYKAIVIGAGITGLSTALAWNKIYSPEDIVIFERNTTPGGCVSTFARKGYRFDTAQIIPDVYNLLDLFGLDDIVLQRFDNYYARLFLADPKTKTAKIFPIHSTRESLEYYLCKNYPSEAQNIARFFSYCTAMHGELNYLKTEPKLKDIPGILYRCPKIIFNSGKTYHRFLKKFNFKNREVFEILDTFSSFSGLSGDRCAALLTAAAMITTLQGSYRPQSGFITFPNSLKKALLAQGTEIFMKTEVAKIISGNGRVQGVRLKNGDFIEADHVISTADTKLTLDSLLDEKPKNSGYFKKADKAKMSPSGFAVQLGLDDEINLADWGFNCGYNVLTTPGAHPKMFDAWEKGELSMSDDCFHLAAISPSLMTGGKTTLIIHVVPAPAEPWISLKETKPEKYNAEKQRIADYFIQKIEDYMIPNLRKHIELIDVSSPATYKRFIGSPTGSHYDMLPVPSNFGKNRLKTRTPVKGLFLPKFSHGIWPCMQAGLQVVDMISGGKIMDGNSSLH